MREIIGRLASLKLAIVLLVLILLVLAIGTIIESLRSAELALSTVYEAFWFRALLGVFAVNVLCSLITHWPWRRARTGFALTHSSLIIILLGGLASEFFKIDGNLAIWEGEDGTMYLGTSGREASKLRSLPFAIHLDEFEIDYYQGTMQPAMFRSRVTVKDTKSGRTLPAVIEMNRGLSYGGYSFYQSSYEQSEGRDKTVLQVSRDPGLPIIMIGYTILMIGMTTVLATRISQHRAMSRANHARMAAPSRGAAAAVIAAGLAVFSASNVSAATLPDAATVETLRRLPVQHDGRVMPFDTMAREVVRIVTRGRGWNGADPVALAIAWSTEPEVWADVPFVALGKGSIVETAGLPEETRRASFNDIVANRKLMMMIDHARARVEDGGKVSGVLKDAQKIDERLGRLQHYFERHALHAIPNPSDPRGPWSVPTDFKSAADLVAFAATNPAAGVASPAAIEREIMYNRVRPHRLSWWILSVATAVSILGWRLGRRSLDVLGFVGLAAGFAVMTWGIALRWQIAGRIPASNMYESLLFLGWGVGLFALIALIFLRTRLVVLNATAMSALAMVLVDRLPMDPFVHPMPPVLSGTPWLAIHVPIIMISYSVLALGVLFAHAQIGFEMFAPRRRDLAARMRDLHYWYIHVGSILLIAGILTGSIWAASSWGRYWGWDPKEVWSLVAFIAYIAILHGRFDRILGPFGVAAFSIVAFWGIIMTYVGVNFVLASGLHAYAAGSSSVVKWLLIVGSVEVLFLGAGLVMHITRRPKRIALMSH